MFGGKVRICVFLSCSSVFGYVSNNANVFSASQGSQFPEIYCFWTIFFLTLIKVLRIKFLNRFLTFRLQIFLKKLQIIHSFQISVKNLLKSIYKSNLHILNRILSPKIIELPEIQVRIQVRVRVGVGIGVRIWVRIRDNPNPNLNLWCENMLNYKVT